MYVEATLLHVGMRYSKILKISSRTGYTLIPRRDTRYVYDADNSFDSAPRKLRPPLSTMNFGLRARHIFHLAYWQKHANLGARVHLEIPLFVARSN